MRMLIMLLLLLAMCGLVVWQFNAQKVVLEKHQQHAAASASVASPQNEQQTQCTQNARARFLALGLEANKSAGFKGHYNTTRSQCYALIESTDVTLDTLWKRVTLYDGDGKVFGTYTWRSEPDRKPTDVPPFNCDLAIPGGGDHRSCSSETEFRFYADSYYMKD